MIEYMNERRKYGNIFPKSVASRIDRDRLIQRSICGHFRTVKMINVHDNFPSDRIDEGISKIKEVVLANEILAVLLNAGISRAYDVITGKLLCEMNPHSCSVVHTIVYNSFNDTLIIAYASFPSHLQCKVIDCKDIRMGKTNSSKLGTLFEKVVLTHPAFFEFCETNGRIGAANLNDNSYIFWNMKTYEPVFEIEEEFQEIRVSDGLVAMFKQPVGHSIPLSLFDIENGDRLVETVIQILPSREMQFLELLVSKLLIKQEGSSLRIYDLLKHTRQKVRDTLTFEPTAFVFYDHPSPVNGKIYNNEMSKRFFTISMDLIEFWELGSTVLKKMYSIRVPGLRNPDLCNHSLFSQLLCVYTTHGNEQVLNSEFYKRIDYLDSKCKTKEIVSDKNDIYDDTSIILSTEGDTNDHRYKQGITDINNNNYNNNNYNINNKYNNNNNNNNKDCLKYEQNNLLYKHYSLCPFEHKQTENTYCCRRHSYFGALLFFSLDNGTFINFLSENVCGNNVTVLASNSSMTTVVCGDDKGVLRILRNNPKFDEFEIKKIDIFFPTNDENIENVKEGTLKNTYPVKRNSLNLNLNEKESLKKKKTHIIINNLKNVLESNEIVSVSCDIVSDESISDESVSYDSNVDKNSLSSDE